MTHAQSARIHAMHRAWQRHGIAVALPDLRSAELSIWLGEAAWIADLEHARSKYAVRLKDKPVVVVFDIKLDAIVTVLPVPAWSVRRGASKRELVGA